MQEQGSIDVPLFLSQKLNSTQKNWTATHKEAYAILWALQRTEKFLQGGEIVVMTDHAALTFLDTAPSPKSVRWALEIQAYGPKIRHVKGEDNTIADWLSRMDLDSEDGQPDRGYAFPALFGKPEEFHWIDATVMAASARKEQELPQQGKRRTVTSFFATRGSSTCRKYTELR